MQKAQVAFVYDWFDTSIGGAERVIQEFHSLYPNAPWYTSHIDRNAVPWVQGWDIRPSFLQHLPLWFRRNRILSLLLLPFAFESFDLSHYETVVSVTSAFAKGVVTHAKTKHICYVLTPPRWLWKDELLKPWDVFIRNILRRWDYVAAQRVDEFISISHTVAERCKHYYGRESTVVYPPFDDKKWTQLHAQCARSDGIKKTRDVPYVCPVSSIQRLAPIRFSYFLVVARLEPYKRVDVVMKAFYQYQVRRTGDQKVNHKTQLIIVGKGSQKSKLRALSRQLNIEDSVIWVDGLSDEELARLYTHCKALIMPQEEDYGYVALEAAWCGAPVIAYVHGGQKEALRDYPNVVFFGSPDAGTIVSALEKIDSIQYNAQTYENSYIRGRSRHSFVATFSQKIPQTV